MSPKNLDKLFFKSGIEHRTFCLPGRYFATELNPWPYSFLFFFSFFWYWESNSGYSNFDIGNQFRYWESNSHLPSRCCAPVLHPQLDQLLLIDQSELHLSLSPNMSGNSLQERSPSERSKGRTLQGPAVLPGSCSLSKRNRS